MKLSTFLVILLTLLGLILLLSRVWVGKSWDTSPGLPGPGMTFTLSFFLSIYFLSFIFAFFFYFWVSSPRIVKKIYHQQRVICVNTSSSKHHIYVCISIPGIYVCANLPSVRKFCVCLYGIHVKQSNQVCTYIVKLIQSVSRSVLNLKLNHSCRTHYCYVHIKLFPSVLVCTLPLFSTLMNVHLE